MVRCEPGALETGPRRGALRSPGAGVAGAALEKAAGDRRSSLSRRRGVGGERTGLRGR